MWCLHTHMHSLLCSHTLSPNQVLAHAKRAADTLVLHATCAEGCLTMSPGEWNDYRVRAAVQAKGLWLEQHTQVIPGMNRSNQKHITWIKHFITHNFGLKLPVPIHRGVLWIPKRDKIREEVIQENISVKKTEISVLYYSYNTNS